jgi:hypothetical protein
MLHLSLRGDAKGVRVREGLSPGHTQQRCAGRGGGGKGVSFLIIVPCPCP